MWNRYPEFSNLVLFKVGQDGHALPDMDWLVLGWRVTVADWLFTAVVGGQQIRCLGRVGEVESMPIRDSYSYTVTGFFIFKRIIFQLMV